MARGNQRDKAREKNQKKLAQEVRMSRRPLTQPLPAA
jgi:4F5 protein family protein